MYKDGISIRPFSLTPLGRRHGSSRVEEYKFEIPNAPGSPDNCMSVSLVMADDRCVPVASVLIYMYCHVCMNTCKVEE